MKCILGKKLGMTTLYDEKQGALNVTLVECAPNKISLLRKEEKDGYEAIQFETEKTKRRLLKKEIRTKEKESFNTGDQVTVEIFQIGDKVSVTGTTKGKGFQGAMKRHGFHGSDKTHGHKHDWRAPGSVGATFPEHVVKGKRMAGRMGGEKSTTKNLKIVHIDTEKNVLGIKGAVPGIPGEIVLIKT